MRRASSRAGTTTLIGPPPTAVAAADRREPAGRPGDRAQGDGAAADPHDQPDRRAPPHHGAAPSAATMSATMRALIATSGSPPPGWLDPPTRYRPRTAPRLPGRRNAARRPFDDVP